ncbi:MAG: CidA/LrgA family protein [Gammaproteobacteria bacterium]|nr:CidA/LrgA family protein [Gammaproteobacteria bacterium]
MTVKLYFRVILEYLVSFAVIVGCLQLGLALQNLSGLPVPGTIFGMLILFGLLASKVIPARWVEPSATLLTQHDFPVYSCQRGSDESLAGDC